METLISAEPARVRNQLTVVETRNDRLGLPQISAELWGTRAAVTQGNSLMSTINLRACRSWGEFYTLDHITPLFKGERCSNIWQSLLTGAQGGYATLQQRQLSESDHTRRRKRGAPEKGQERQPLWT